MVNCIFKRTANAILCLAFSINIGAKTIQIRSSYGGLWETKNAMVVDEVEGFTKMENARDAWNRYGSYKYLRADSTGYFHVQKIDGRWWLIDPDGYAGINRAVTSFADPTTVQYTRRYNFYQTYKSKRKNYYPDFTTPSGDYVFVLDPKFETFCMEAAESNISPFVAERDMIGWFTDNEIPFNEDQLGYLITRLDSLDPSRSAARAWAIEHGITENDIRSGSSKVTDNIKKQFAGYLAERYFSVVQQAIRNVDNVHMILGSRLHGRPRANSYVVNASHAHTDVTSVNFYDRYNPNDQIAKSTWTMDHPCLVTEFYTKDITVYSSEQSGAGWYVPNQQTRGYWYENTCLELLASKCYIGWQYFRYMDDSGNSNKGIVSLNKEEYTDMTLLMRELNEQVYALCDYYDNVCRDTVCTEPYMQTQIVAPVRDDASGGTMEVCYARSSSARKSAVLQFALPSGRGPVRHAVLRLNVASADNKVHHLLISAVNGMNDTQNDKGRIAYDINPIAAGWHEYDITTYLSEQNADSLTLRLHALIATNQSIQFYSTQAAQDVQPQLVITYMDSISTGFTSVQVEDNDLDQRIYSLFGQSIGTETNALPAGIYIKNGKKMIKHSGL